MKASKPIKLIPATKAYIWGGTTLKEKWGKSADTETIAECWELSSFHGSESVCADSGKPLSAIIKEHPEYFGGKASESYFPILVKLIDAAGDLSIQVHPDDSYAAEHENGSFGKTEMWYIADCKENASIFYGFSRDVSRSEVEESIKNNTVTDLLMRVPVKKGDTYFVPAGTVHALLSGVTVIEIQQNSNITYRVYDYDRRDKDGNPRELHVAKALDVLDYSGGELLSQSTAKKNVNGVSERELAECKYFKTSEIKLSGGTFELAYADGFMTFTVAEGEGAFSDGRGISKGETWLIPATAVESITGQDLTIILTKV